MSLKPKACDFDLMWPKLKHTTTNVIQMKSVDKNEWNERIHDVYNLCIALPGMFFVCFSLLFMIFIYL